MNVAVMSTTFSADEASCVTDAPLKQVHRIIVAGLLNDTAAGGPRPHRSTDRDRQTARCRVSLSFLVAAGTPSRLNLIS